MLLQRVLFALLLFQCFPPRYFRFLLLTLEFLLYFLPHRCFRCQEEEPELYLRWKEDFRQGFLLYQMSLSLRVHQKGILLDYSQEELLISAGWFAAMPGQ